MSANDKNRDKAIIKKYLENKEIHSFEEIVKLYEKKVYSLCFHYVSNEQGALDLTQEVFIRVYKNLANFRFDSAFSTWLYRLTSNTCIDYLRKNKKNQYLSYDESIATTKEKLLQQSNDIYVDPEKMLERKELTMLVRQAVLMLPEDQKIVIILRDLQGLSYEEIVEILQVSLGTVKSRINRGRAKLKKILLEGELFVDKKPLMKQRAVKSK